MGQIRHGCATTTHAAPVVELSFAEVIGSISGSFRSAEQAGQKITADLIACREQAAREEDVDRARLTCHLAYRGNSLSRRMRYQRLISRRVCVCPDQPLSQPTETAQ